MDAGTLPARDAQFVWFGCVSLPSEITKNLVIRSSKSADRLTPARSARAETCQTEIPLRPGWAKCVRYQGASGHTTRACCTRAGKDEITELDVTIRASG
jgi:hypothetical protein